MNTVWVRAGMASALLLAAAAAPAALRIESFQVTATASAFDARWSGAPVMDLSDTDAWGLPIALTATREDTAFGEVVALQTKSGFFANQVSAGIDWRGTQLRASTSNLVVVSTDTPDTQLDLQFTFVGSQLGAAAYYAAGQIEASAGAYILASKVPAANTLPTTAVWSVMDSVQLQDDRFSAPASIVDLQGVGQPQRTQADGWQDFQRIGSVQRGQFTAELDFGLLQPGEYFAFAYTAFASVSSSGVNYGGSANALLIDPFELTTPPGAMLAMPGLTLPASPVPEPASSVLALLSGAALWLRMRSRSRPMGADATA